MKTPLAWLNLLHSKLRTLAAVAGVTFAVVLVFMQLGFLGAVEQTASVIYDALDFDLIIRSRRYLNLADTQSFPHSRLHLIESMPKVERVTALQIGLNQWRNPNDGAKRRILVFGVTPGEPMFVVDEIQQKATRLTVPKLALIDRRSRYEFGPHNGRRFGDADIGLETEVGGQRIRVVDHFSLGAGFAADGAILLSDRGFCRVQPGRKAEDVSLGLVKLEPEADVEAVAKRLRHELPQDVDVFTRNEVLEYERDFWVNEMSIGIIFQLGVVVALVVGTAIVYQVLSSDVSNHLSEYATLKAMGYGNSFLGKVVLQQAVALALLAFVPGLLLSEMIYRITTRVANVPIEMNWGRVLLVLALSVGMCAISGLGALRKVRAGDPADLF